mmetsp:Transcript_14051/g.35352  ORF Transcript_14051/g.35352 Transcript_14051/m.35352 type:complete len:505 (+) Transcript_14051:220-1734(+)
MDHLPRPDEEEDEELGPTHVNTTRASHLVKVHKDKLTVSYTGKANHTNDVGAVLANRPFANKVLIGYFEMTVQDAGARGCMAIGLGNATFNVMRHPGYEPGSYGYHGDDGKKFQESGRGEPYGPKFTTGDTVGCGLHFGTREIFFTKNGKHLGVGFTNPCHSYYPAVGLHSEGEILCLNFGHQPFKFRLDDMIREEREKLHATISRIPMNASLVNGIVRNYLEHYACHKALEAFPKLDDGSSAAPPPHATQASISIRKEIRELLVQGKLPEACAKIEESFPTLMSSSPKVRAHLRCQEFIEHLREGRRDVALRAAQQHIAPLLHLPPTAPSASTASTSAASASSSSQQQQPSAGSRPGTSSASHSSSSQEGMEANGNGHSDGNKAPSERNGSSSRSEGGMEGGEVSPQDGEGIDDELRTTIQQVIGLLAYADPKDSPLAAVFDESHRRLVADVVNSSILTQQGGNQTSSLEKLLLHLLVSHDTLRQLQGGRGEVLELRELIQPS